MAIGILRRIFGSIKISIPILLFSTPPSHSSRPVACSSSFMEASALRGSDLLATIKETSVHRKRKLKELIEERKKELKITRAYVIPNVGGHEIIVRVN